MVDWEEFSHGVFLVNVLGIVYNPAMKKILIAERRDDKHVKELTWVFPGGRIKYDRDIEEHFKDVIKEKVGVEVKEEEFVFARTYTEKREFLSIYLLCVTDDTEAKPLKFYDVKWIKPTDVKKYFTTSLHPKLYEFLEKLEKEGL